MLTLLKLFRVSSPLPPPTRHRLRFLDGLSSVLVLRVVDWRGLLLPSDAAVESLGRCGGAASASSDADTALSKTPMGEAEACVEACFSVVAAAIRGGAPPSIRALVVNSRGTDEAEVN